MSEYNCFAALAGQKNPGPQAAHCVPLRLVPGTGRADPPWPGALDAWEDEGGSLPVPDSAAVPEGSARCSGAGLPFVAISESLPLGILVTDPDGNCVYANPAYQHMTGRSPEQLLGAHWSAAVHPLDRERMMDGWASAVVHGQPFMLEGRLVGASGAATLTRRNVAQLDDPDLGAGHVHTIEDIGSYRQTELAWSQIDEYFHEESARARVTLDSIGDAVISTDTRGNVSYMNAVAEQMTGWARENALGRPLAEVFRVVDSNTRQSAQDPAQRAIEQDCKAELAGNCVLLHQDGSEVEIEDSAAPIHDREGNVIGAVIVFRDVKYSYATINRMIHLARHDHLTGLPNRLVLKEQLTQALGLAERHGERVAVLFIDIKHFKHVNDTFGHATGDGVLRDVARHLVRSVRSTDTVCRYGGDEFVVLLSAIKRKEGALLAAGKILETVTFSEPNSGHDVPVALNIGISLYPDHGVGCEVLLRKADTAMYQAKAAGQAVRVCSPGGGPSRAREDHRFTLSSVSQGTDKRAADRGRSQ